MVLICTQVDRGTSDWTNTFIHLFFILNNKPQVFYFGTPVLEGKKNIINDPKPVLWVGGPSTLEVDIQWMLQSHTWQPLSLNYKEEGKIGRLVSPKYPATSIHGLSALCLRSWKVSGLSLSCLMRSTIFILPPNRKYSGPSLIRPSVIRNTRLSSLDLCAFYLTPHAAYRAK